MSVRHFPFYILFLLASATGLAQGSRNDPTSFWWYPMGPIEGTRQNLAPSLSQTADELVIRWRAPQLRNSPVLLVGALRLEEGGTVAARQQIVGITSDTLYILSADGTVERRVVYGKGGTLNLFATPAQLSLTGLFNLGRTSGSPRPSGRPNVIGVGVERTEQSGNNLDSLSAFLADSNGIAQKKIAIPPIPATAGGQRAGIYPVAAYYAGGNPIVISAVSQNAPAISGKDTNASALRADVLGSPDPAVQEVGRRLWSYPIAPRSYPQHPAILVDPDRLGLSYSFSLSTASSPVTPKVTVVPDLPSSLPTRSDSIYSITIADSVRKPGHVETRPLAPPGEANSYIVTLADTASNSAEFYTLITENHDDANPGTPKILLTKPGVQKEFGSFVDNNAQNLGWTIVAADLDGRALPRLRNPNFPDDTLYKIFPNNSDAEIVAARRRSDGSDIADNVLYVIRRNRIDSVGGRQMFRAFIQQPFSGRLMAAGDIVSDPDNRRELVIANGSTVTVLQLIDYNSDRIRNVFIPDFFDTVRTVTFDSRVVSVAIADIDGDGNNELIVNTETATYAVGKRMPGPFRDLAADSALYCQGKQVKVLWNRIPGGGQGGVRITLQSTGRPDSVIAYAHHPAKDIDPLNPGVGPDSIIIPTSALRPGTYQVRIQDTIVPVIDGLTAPFVVNQPVIHDVAIDTGSAPRFGEQIRVSASVDCASALIPLFSTNGGVTWDTLIDVTVSGNRTEARKTFDCGGECGDQQDVTVLFHFIDSNNFAHSDIQTVRLSAPMRTLGLAPNDPDSRARRRAISWQASDFNCTMLRIALSADSGRTWQFIARNIPAGLLGYPVEIPDDISGSLKLRVCCETGTQASCDYGVSPSFAVDKLPDGNYVAPNPFDPGDHSGTSNGAAIVFRMKGQGAVSITIFDASRTVVRQVLSGAEVAGGERKREFWDGRNSRGEIVANGTYICVIESGSGERIVLPIIVLKHR
ncbi:MAG: hypothetical protein JWQ98_275 [Chlorobi bacterium]|nr:hypothetical protein [Chlorobiota bacterium]